MLPLNLLVASVTLVAASVTKTGPSAPPPTPPPTPQEAAWRILSGVHLAIGKAQPAVQPFLLMHLAENTAPFNRKTALVEFRDAFFDARIMEKTYRVPLQSEISAAVSSLDIATAMELVRSIHPEAAQAFARDTWDHSIEFINIQNLDRNRPDDAVELIKLVSTPGIFPNEAASMTMRSLPASDDRRLALFGYAATCYRQIPFPGFSRLIQDHWQTMPRPLAVMAADAVADEAPHVASGELLAIFPILREVDPPRAERLLSDYPELADRPTPKPRNPTYEERNNEQVLDQISRLARKHPQQALGMMDQIRDPDMRKELILQIASNTLNGGDDPGTANAALQALMRLPDTRQGEVSATLASLAVAAGKPDLAKHYVDLSFDFAARLLQTDLDAKSECGINTAPKDWWPSTAAYRAAVHAAAALFHTAAEPYLARVQDTDLYLLMNLEFARALLGRGPTRTPQLTCTEAAAIAGQTPPS